MRQEAANTGETLDPKIANKPHLHLGLALYYNAWFELDTERNRAEGERIKRSACFEYAYDYEFSEEQREDLWFYVQHMDRAFLNWQASKRPPKPKA